MFGTLFAWLLASALFVACTPDGGTGDAGVGAVAQVASSSRSVTIAWSSNGAENYVVSLYRDSECVDKHQEFEISIKNLPSPRFTFSGLEPATSYVARVTDAAGVELGRTTVESAAQELHFERKVLFQDFDRVAWGGDYYNRANGIKYPTTSTYNFKPTSFDEVLSPENAVATTKWQDGVKYSQCSSELVSLFGLSGWECVGVMLHPGYVKLGISSIAGRLTSPQLTAIPANTDVKVSFNVCGYSASGAAAAGSLSLELVSSITGKVKNTATVTYDGHGGTPKWQSLSVTLKGASGGDRVVISAASGEQLCIDNILVTALVDIPEGMVYGYVYDSKANPIKGVAVSDGFSVVATDDAGYYSLEPSSDTWYIYVSLPSDCEVPTNEYGLPCFYQRYSSEQQQYDFTLTKLPGGAEQQFALMCFADPQVSREVYVKRFANESVPDIKKHVESKGMPCYGITLGDIISSSDTHDAEPLLVDMRKWMDKKRVGMPIFQVMGNHDHKGYTTSGYVIEADATSSTPNLRVQREFEDVFGPINYSFNRGEMHIIGMRDIIYNDNTKFSDYKAGFTDEQYKWLRQDLALVPKNKVVVLCVHSPIYNQLTKPHVKDVFNLMNEFAEAHVMSGHTHYGRNVENVNATKVFEHVTATVCGSWWGSTINGDGAPNGYAVYEANGNTFANWYYKGVNEGLNDPSYQIRLYRGNLLCGGTYEYFKAPYEHSTLLANVWNADSQWKIEVYDGATKLGDMTYITPKNGDPYNGSNDIKEYIQQNTSKTNPTVGKADSSNDWWAVGYLIGVKGQKRSQCLKTAYNLYKFEGLTDAQMKRLKVRATDRFGNVYEATGVIEEEFQYVGLKAPTW